jgi:hypothetical protein
VSGAKIVPLHPEHEGRKFSRKDMARRPRRKNRTCSSYSTIDIAKLMKLTYPVKN